MSFTMEVRISDKLMTRLKNRSSIKQSVAYIMNERMNEAVMMARNTCPVRTGFLQSCVNVIEWNPDEPMISGGVVMKGRPTRMTVLGIAFEKGRRRGYPYGITVQFRKRAYVTRGLLRTEVGGYFDPTSNKIVVATHPHGVPGTDRKIEEVLAHEFWHAIQKQHMVGLKRDYSEREAERVAARAMGEFRPYAVYVEFGTRKMVARPFWRPAVWEAFFRMLEDFRKINSGKVRYG